MKSLMAHFALLGRTKGEGLDLIMLEGFYTKLVSFKKYMVLCRSRGDGCTFIQV